MHNGPHGLPPCMGPQLSSYTGKGCEGFEVSQNALAPPRFTCRRGIGNDMCTHSQDAGVVCLDNPAKGDPEVAVASCSMLHAGCKEHARGTYPVCMGIQLGLLRL